MFSQLCKHKNDVETIRLKIGPYLERFKWHLYSEWDQFTDATSTKKINFNILSINLV